MAKTRFTKLDVRPILARGNEPCSVVEAELGRLGEGQGISVVAPFLPSPLIERLKAAGYNARADRLADNSWQVDFWRD